MSFVGTRPEVTKYVKKYTKEIQNAQKQELFLTTRIDNDTYIVINYEKQFSTRIQPSYDQRYDT